MAHEAARDGGGCALRAWETREGVLASALHGGARRGEGAKEGKDPKDALVVGEEGRAEADEP